MTSVKLVVKDPLMKEFGSTCNYVLCAYADWWCSGVGLVTL